MESREELEALWAEIYGGPPSIRAEPPVLAAVLVSSLPPVPAYTPAAAEPLQPSTKAADAGFADSPTDPESP